MEYDHFSYMENIARTLRAIRHGHNDRRFFRCSSPEALEELLSNYNDLPPDVPILVAVDDLTESFSEPDQDAIFSAPEYGFLVLQHVETGNDEDLFAKRAYCRALAKKIVAKMLRDSCSQTHPLGNDRLSRSSIVIDSQGPFGDNYHGVLVWFSLQRAFAWTDTPNDWL
jgi:hypothetical protein